HENELQIYFVKRMEKFINSKGKKIVGWDEILEGGLAPEATVQSWRGVKGAIEAAKMGHDVIVSPTTHCYLDYSVETTDLRKVYFFDPVPEELSFDERKHVLGSEGLMWTEYAPQELVDDRLFPRMLALSEVIWNYPQERNFDSFLQRVQNHYKRLNLLDVNYGLETKPFEITKTFNPAKNVYDIKVTQLQNDIDLRIGSFISELVINQTAENEFQFEIDKTNLVNIFFQQGEKKIGKTYAFGISFNKANRKQVKLSYPYSEKYSAGGIESLTDGIRGSDSFRGGDNTWQGYYGTDFEAIVDLEKPYTFNKISAGFFQASSSLVVFPQYIEFYTSVDGNEYVSAGKVEIPSTLRNPDWIQKDFGIQLDDTYARYIKIFAKNYDELPKWHPIAHGKAWLMVDEIIVE
ncbi:MAG: family 20 glycosylhydrolase, partial [Ignavibacteriaceae bacterium]|nr:family 20 glycosylhydrolase [Ignavibacteriaceae bacterium]